MYDCAEFVRIREKMLGMLTAIDSLVFHVHKDKKDEILKITDLHRQDVTSMKCADRYSVEEVYAKKYQIKALLMNVSTLML